MVNEGTHNITLDSTIFDGVSRSVDQLCGQLSLANINIPTFTAGLDVIKFITNFEIATSTLTEVQRSSLLAKAFADSQFQAWFEFDLKPLIDSKTEWSIVKDKIIDRFSLLDKHDKHVRLLRELKYDPEDTHGLLLFVENMLFSYRKVFPDNSSEEAPVKYIKAALPQHVQAQLYLNTKFREAKSDRELRDAALLYDKAKGSEKSHPNNEPKGNELASIFKEIISSIHQENEKNRIVMMNVLQEHKKSFNTNDSRSDRYERGRSPVQFVGQNTTQRPVSPRYKSRSPSPRRTANQGNASGSKLDTNHNSDRIESSNPNAFDTEDYYKKFNRPVRPCSHCGYWHWDRHCLKYLN